VNGEGCGQRRPPEKTADRPRGELQSPEELSSLVRELTVSVWAFAALACADEAGLLEELFEPRSLTDLAERTSLPVPIVSAVVDILVSLGLVRPEAGPVFVAEPVLAPALGGPERSVLRAELRSNLLQSVQMVTDARRGRLAPGWLPADPLVLHAQGDRSAFLPAAWIEHVFPALDGLLERLAGTRASFLDVGVGVARLTIGLCSRFPTLTAVGLDPLAQVLSEARANVEAHSLANRVELRRGRVEDLEDRSAFDLVHIPAMFLSPSTLAAGLSRIQAALRPGGWVLIQTLTPQDDSLASAVVRLWCTLWGGESLSLRQVVTLLNLEGFESAKAFPALSGLPIGHAAGRRPLCWSSGAHPVLRRRLGVKPSVSEPEGNPPNFPQK